MGAQLPLLALSLSATTHPGLHRVLGLDDFSKREVDARLGAPRPLGDAVHPEVLRPAPHDQDRAAAQRKGEAPLALIVVPEYKVSGGAKRYGSCRGEGRRMRVRERPGEGHEERLTKADYQATTYQSQAQSRKEARCRCATPLCPGRCGTD